jgi:hypothetical protein
VGEKKLLVAKRQKLLLNAFELLALVEVMNFVTADAYSNLGLKSEKREINK